MHELDVNDLNPVEAQFSYQILRGYKWPGASVWIFAALPSTQLPEESMGAIWLDETSTGQIPWKNKKPGRSELHAGQFLPCLRIFWLLLDRYTETFF